MISSHKEIEVTTLEGVMKDDYLWDKSGEPDPEIKKLEEILGTLRYQPQPLEIPENLRITRRQRNYVPLLAIAATIVIALLSGIVWFSVKTGTSPQQHQAQTPAIPTPLKEKVTVTEGNKNDSLPGKPSENVAKISKPRNRTYISTAKKREQEEALAAKEQLMVALRLASEKLNLAQRKIHTAQPPANQIKNQHRVG